MATCLFTVHINPPGNSGVSESLVQPIGTTNKDK